MPKINVNGVVREMTEEEAREYESIAAGISGQPKSELEKRLEEVEGALKLLLEGATE